MSYMTHDERNDLEIISSYSRADALRDGELIDVTPWAKEGLSTFGAFTCPVALTRALFYTASDFDVFLGEDVRARITDILSAAVLSIRLSNNPSSPFIRFKVLLTDAGGVPQSHDLILHCGPGDSTELVVTIGFPEDF